MTAQEFKDRTGIQLSDEQMWALHEVYMTGEQSKDYFCALIKSQYDADRCNLEYMLDLGRRLAEERKQAENKRKELEARIKDLQEWMLRQTVNCDYEVLDNLKAKCKQIYGEKEFYARFIDLDGELGSDDLTNIAALLRK